MYSSVAARKAGPAIDRFLRKIEQQMGVVIVGFAAYRNEMGKLCTFKYVFFVSQSLALINILLLSFCTPDPRENTFLNNHSIEAEKFIKDWGKWVADHGKKFHLNNIFIYLLSTTPLRSRGCCIKQPVWESWR